MGIGRSEGGPRWRRRVFELVSNSGTTVVWPALETNVVSKQKKVQCWIVHLAERCSVRTRRALRVAPPLPTWQFFTMNNDDDFELFIMINYRLRVAHWHRGHSRLDQIIDKKTSPPRQGLPPPAPQQKYQTVINIVVMMMMIVSSDDV